MLRALRSFPERPDPGARPDYRITGQPPGQISDAFPASGKSRVDKSGQTWFLSPPSRQAIGLMSSQPKLLIIEARFYGDIADALAEGAIGAIEAAGAQYDRIAVPGVLEIPAAVQFALDAAEKGTLDKPFDGFVTLGVVIRGETTHYDIVSNESARALMDLTVTDKIALGNGIQTVENSDQAWARANVSDKNKGGGAAAAAIAMINLTRKYSS